MADPWTDKHRADRAKAKADAAKDEIAQRDRRVVTATAERRTAQAGAAKAAQGYPWPKPIWQNG